MALKAMNALDYQEWIEVLHLFFFLDGLTLHFIDNVYTYIDDSKCDRARLGNELRDE